MAGDVTREKATIINLDRGGAEIKCLFNPREYTFAKQNSWKPGGGGGANMPTLQFDNGQPATLSLQLFFDTYGEREDVRKKHTDAIWELMMVDETLKDSKTDKTRPPRVQFKWGKAWAFEAVITSISQKFTLFLADGTPVRATLDVAFQQVKDTRQLAPQNPSSGGDGGERMWRVNSGDTLALISYREYGDPSRWRLIAEANHLFQVRELVPGTVLVIPHG